MSIPSLTVTPNPGSVAALRWGCMCPVVANHHGEYPPPCGDWQIAVRCPVHSTVRSPAPAKS